MMDSLNRDQKAVVIALFMIFILSGIMYLISPLMINAYFNQQPLDDIWGSSFNATNRGMMGKVVIINSHVSIVHSGSFEFIEKLSDGRDGRILTAHHTNKMNCKPTEGLNRKIAGAWNVGSGGDDLYKNRNISFYAVWIVDGC